MFVALIIWLALPAIGPTEFLGVVLYPLTFWLAQGDTLARQTGQTVADIWHYLLAFGLAALGFVTFLIGLVKARRTSSAQQAANSVSSQ